MIDPNMRPSRMMDNMANHIASKTLHVRRGALTNAFSYGVDYVLLDLDDVKNPLLLSRNRFNLWSVWDRHHGGMPNAGTGKSWCVAQLNARGFDTDGAEILLLTQPSFLGYHFNPVSFWLACKGGKLRAVISEVNNTFGHRHCYFCAHADFRPIKKSDRLYAEKMMHVSPFQQVKGEYAFNFDFSANHVHFLINYRNGAEGVFATLKGKRQRATNPGLLQAALRRPFGALRVMTLIHWQAIKLWAKRAPFLKKPPPPETLISPDPHRQTLPQTDTKRATT